MATGVINGSEECDGNVLGGTTCLDLGCRSGDLTCNPDCTFDITSCYVGHDEDGDSVDDNCDNCPTYENLNQADADADGVGDVCEAPGDDTVISSIQIFDPMLDDEASWTVTRGTWDYGSDVVSGTAIPEDGNYLNVTSLSGDPFGVEGTFYFTQASPPDSSWTAIIFSIRTTFLGITAYECVYQRENQQLQIWRLPTLSTDWSLLEAVDTNTTVPASGWHKIHAFYDGSKVVCEYLDESGAAVSAEITGGDVANDMSGTMGLRVYNERAVFTSFVAYE